jgi:hypothetical protein
MDGGSRNGIRVELAIRDESRNGQGAAGTESRFGSESGMNLETDSPVPVHFEIGLTCEEGGEAPEEGGPRGAH